MCITHIPDSVCGGWLLWKSRNRTMHVTIMIHGLPFSVSFFRFSLRARLEAGNKDSESESESNSHSHAVWKAETFALN